MTLDDLLKEWNREDERKLAADERIGFWLSAALDDPNVCEEMKRDIREWFQSHKVEGIGPMLYRRIYEKLAAMETLGAELGHLNSRGQKLLNWLRRRYGKVCPHDGEVCRWFGCNDHPEQDRCLAL